MLNLFSTICATPIEPLIGVKLCHIICAPTLYKNLTGHLFHNLEMPSERFVCHDPNCKNGDHLYGLQTFYTNIITCLKSAANNRILFSMFNESGFNVVPGWNEHMRNFHNAARDAFKVWVVNGRPNSGQLFDLLWKTHAKKSCKRDEGKTRAEAMANNLTLGGFM